MSATKMTLRGTLLVRLISCLLSKLMNGIAEDWKGPVVRRSKFGFCI